MQTYIAVNEETGMIKSYVGEDATRLYQVKIIIQGLKALNYYFYLIEPCGVLADIRLYHSRFLVDRYVSLHFCFLVF